MRKIFIALCAGTLLAAPLSAPSVHYAQGAEALSVEARGRWEKDVDVAKLYDAVVETIDQRFYDEGILKKLDWRARPSASPVCSLRCDGSGCCSPDQRALVRAEDLAHRPFHAG